MHIIYSSACFLLFNTKSTFGGIKALPSHVARGLSLSGSIS